MGSVNRAPPKKGGFSRAPPGRALVCHERGTGLGAVNGAPLMGCERLGGVSSMGSPPCPLFRCSGCASQPCSRQGGGGCALGTPTSSVFWGSHLLLPLWGAQTPIKEQHPPNSGCPGGLQLPSSQNPRDSAARSSPKPGAPGKGNRPRKETFPSSHPTASGPPVEFQSMTI